MQLVGGLRLLTSEAYCQTGAKPPPPQASRRPISGIRLAPEVEIAPWRNRIGLPKHRRPIGLRLLLINHGLHEFDNLIVFVTAIALGCYRNYPTFFKIKKVK